MENRDITKLLNLSVTALQMAIAAFLVVLLFAGVINLGLLIFGSAYDGEIFSLSAVLSLLVSSIDIVLYLFIIVELYNTIVAYVEARSVVLAVIHAGLIAAVRQIIVFKPSEAETAMDALMQAGTYSLLLLVLLIGFYIVHFQLSEDELDEGI